MEHLFLYDDNQRFVLCSSTVHDERFAIHAGAIVAREMNQLGRNDPRVSSVKEGASPPFDFYGQTPFDHMQQFLGAGMHVPGSGDAGRKFDDANDGLLDDLALALEVIS
jgi:hypothetical protein